MKRVVLLSQLGERELIRKIAVWCKPSFQSPDWYPKVGQGDDAFVAKMASNSTLVVTTDTLLEGTHFRLNWKSPYLHGINLWQALGHKAMASNLSDLAAMGYVIPLFVLVTLGLNGDISVDNVDNLYRGICKLSRLFRFSIVGGDIIRSDKSIISITVVGRKLSPNVITRSGAKKGDVLMVTGPIGPSSAGLQLLENRVNIRTEVARTMVRSHLFPMPQFSNGKILSIKANMATSLMDTSDDLVTSLETLADASRVGFNIDLDSIALPSALTAAAKALKCSPWSLFLYGGEDYQLLFTIAPEKASRILEKIPSSFILGQVTDRKLGIQIRQHGRPLIGRDTRFKHF